MHRLNCKRKSTLQDEPCADMGASSVEPVDTGPNDETTSSSSRSTRCRISLAQIDTTQ
uniref:Uncharacterized protein n=1 Tax=Arundo donax TaxID=35708 RepID=A0A0A9FML3_ARUDO